MKKSSGDPEAAAWGLLASNLLVLPGLGSVAGGRRTAGWMQMALAVAGLLLTGWFVTAAAYALFRHRTELVEAAGDVSGIERVELLLPDWKRDVSLGVAGFCLFLGGWVWGLMTSRELLAEARAAASASAADTCDRRPPPTAGQPTHSHGVLELKQASARIANPPPRLETPREHGP